MNLQGVTPWQQLAAKQAQDKLLPRETGTQRPGVWEQEHAGGEHEDALA